MLPCGRWRSRLGCAGGCNMHLAASQCLLLRRRCMPPRFGHIELEGWSKVLEPSHLTLFSLPLCLRPLVLHTQGRPPGVIGMWPSRGITFIDNHDTGSTLNHWPFPQRHIAEGYAYILTHPGTPCVFWDHLYTEQGGLRKVIQDLVDLRRRHNINARSKVTVRKATADVYAASIDDKVAMKIGSGDWSPQSTGLRLQGRDMKLVCSGVNFAVWETS